LSLNNQKNINIQIMLFVHFLGTNGFYHLIRDARGPSSHTVFRTVHRVAEAISSLQDEVIRWPEDCTQISKKFFDIGGFPQVAGCVDGTHITVSPRKQDEEACLNRKSTHSLNVMVVCGPDLQFFYINANFPGRCHDSRVLRQTQLWETFETLHQRPFPGAVILGDSGYPLRDWLITPYQGEFSACFIKLFMHIINSVS
jgi:hypothetical protein